jgi:hypothetical protein
VKIGQKDSVLAWSYHDPVLPMDLLVPLASQGCTTQRLVIDEDSRLEIQRSSLGF